MSSTIDATPGLKELGATTERATRGALRNEKVRALSRREPLGGAPGTLRRDGIRRMQEANSGVLLVVEDARVVGALTEGDVLRRVLAKSVDLGDPVDGVMTRDVTTLQVEATVGEAMSLMERGGYRMLPLVDEAGRLAGIVHQREVLEYIAEAFPQEILNLPPRPHQLMEAPEGA